MFLVLGTWAIYNTVRYFLAYAVYSSTNGQMVSLALGTSTTLSIALLLSATILSIFGPFLLLCHYPIRSLLIIRTTLHYLSSFFLFGPAVVSLAFVFVWRHSPDPEVTLGRRCRLDIDVIWSVTSANCRPSAWGTWLALSIIRVVTTLAVIVSYNSSIFRVVLYSNHIYQIIYHIASSAYHNIRRPSQKSRRRHRHRHRQHLNPSESTNHPSLVSPQMTGSGVSTLSPISTLPLSHQHRVSHFSIVSNANSRQTSERRSLRSSRASSLRRPPSVNSTSARINRMSGLSDSSSEDISGDEAYNRLPPNLQQRTNIENSPSPNSTEGDRDIHNFVDRFRSLVSQITRETEDGLEFADESTSSLPIASSSTAPDFGNQYKTPSLPAPALGYDEFGRPYPPEENVRILNNIIRRMPTIESMGSREVGSVAGSNWGHDRMASSRSIQSHPPTRANTLDHTGSESLSRSNSFSIAHGFIDEMGEVGESAEERGERRNVRRTRSGSTRTGSSGTTGTGGSHPSVSRSTTSYNTATSSGSPWQSVNVSAGHSGPDTEESVS